MVQAAKKQKMTTGEEPASKTTTTTTKSTSIARDVASDVKVGVIGCGRIGMLHLEALTKAPGVTPIICANPTIARAQEAAQKFSIAKYASDPMDVINDPEVQAVWICSPSQFHADQIKACAAAGKHVFCEKPIATNLKETMEAMDACQDAGVKLMIGLQRRFDANFLRVKRSIESEEIGRVFMIKLCSRDPSPPPVEYVKGGGGIFADMAIHDLDMSRFLAGAEPVDVMATGSCQIDPTIRGLPGSEKYDTATCLVRYPDGVTATIDVCRQSCYGYDQRAELLGTKGMIETDNVYPNTAKLSTSDRTGNADMPYDFFLQRYNQAYTDETLAFCKSLTEKTAVPCSGNDGLMALILARAADKSAAEQRFVSVREIVEELELDSGKRGSTSSALANVLPLCRDPQLAAVEQTQ